MIYVFIGLCYGVVENGFCIEEILINLLIFYGRIKVEGEKMVLVVGGTVLRLVIVFGILFRLRFDLLVNDLIYKVFILKYFDFY